MQSPLRFSKFLRLTVWDGSVLPEPVLNFLDCYKEQRLKVVTDELNQAAIEAKKNAPKREKTCYFERAKMKRDAARLAKKPRAPKDQTKGRSKKQGIE